MSLAQSKRSARAGFTLPEMLVAVAMVGVLSAVVLPTVIGQISKGEIARIVQDLQSVEAGTQMFRNDVGKWPATATQLISSSTLNNQPALVTTTGTTGFAGGTGNFAANAETLWQGPYLSRGNVGSGLPTSGSGTIELTFRHLHWDTDDTTSPSFVVIVVSGLTAANRTLVDQAVDGTANLDSEDPTAGKIRVDGSDLLYYTSPAK